MSLEKDFDPTFKTGVSSKKEGRKLLARGIELLAEYQSQGFTPRTPMAYSSCSKRSTPPERTERFDM